MFTTRILKFKTPILVPPLLLGILSTSVLVAQTLSSAISHFKVGIKENQKNNFDRAIEEFTMAIEISSHLVPHRMRAQLADIQAQQTDLQTRLAQLDEEIKPETIERSLAGVGSVHPEELREARRRQLEIQRRGIQSQLDWLTATRQHLESAIAAADAESYRQMVGLTQPPFLMQAARRLSIAIGNSIG
jgi:hypothetical protein